MIGQDRLRLLLALYDRRLRQVAEDAGVPLPTASRIVNGKARAAPETLARIEAAIITGRPVPPTAPSPPGTPPPAAA